MYLLFNGFILVVLFLRVQKEVDDVIGMKKDISYDDLGPLIYLSQVQTVEMRKIMAQLSFGMKHV